MNDYSLLTIIADGVTGHKPKDKWIKEEELAVTCNYWALNAIYMELPCLSFKELLHALLQKKLEISCRLCMKGLTLSNNRNFRSCIQPLKP